MDGGWSWQQTVLGGRTALHKMSEASMAALPCVLLTDDGDGSGDGSAKVPDRADSGLSEATTHTHIPPQGRLRNFRGRQWPRARFAGQTGAPSKMP